MSTHQTLEEIFDSTMGEFGDKLEAVARRVAQDIITLQYKEIGTEYPEAAEKVHQIIMDDFELIEETDE